MAPHKKPSTHQPAKDFAKRPKAKVGKRAPAKLNATDTSFKTSSVVVRSQATSLDKNAKKSDVKSSLLARMELQSSRGNALSTLQASLRHHAPTVRCSGLKGIRDAVQSLACKGECLNSEDVEVYNLGISILESNLPTLLPNMCRCWLDEDGDVRDLAIQLFGDILTNLSVQSKVTNDGGVTSHLTCLVPFVPFLCAYALSALNSLDRSIRKDGALLVGMMASCTSHQSFSLLKEDYINVSGSEALKIEIGKHVDLFLPSLERLLSSMSFGGRTKPKQVGGGKNEKKRKREANSSSNPTDSTLSSGFKSLGAADATILSLALLLKASLEDNNNSNTLKDNELFGHKTMMPSIYISGECSFLQGGSAYANSMLIFREAQRQDDLADVSLRPINGIFDLPLMHVYDSIESPNTSSDEHISRIEESSAQSQDGNIAKAVILSTLVETLRVKYLELTQTGRTSNGDRKGIMLTVPDLDTLNVLVKALKFSNRYYQLFRESLDPSLLRIKAQNTSMKRKKKGTLNKKASNDDCLEAYQSSITKTVSLILEHFPVHSFDGKSSASRYNLTNAELCSSLVELGGKSADSPELSTLWVDAVFSYIIPRLALDDHDLTSFGVQDEEVIEVLLKIARKLLLPIGRCDSGSGLVYPLQSSSKRQELLQVFGNVFFPHKLAQRSARDIESLTTDGKGSWLKIFASTSAGRTAARLLTSLISWLSDDCMNKEESACLFILQLASVLPIYLSSWQHQFPMETGEVLSSMMSVAKQWSLKTSDSSTNWDKALTNLCLGYQESIGVMFQRSRLKQAKGTSQMTSIFERLPDPIQRLTIGLVSMLGCLNETVAAHLAKICSRAICPKPHPEEMVASASMASYIFEVMHGIRKTMQMSTYLTFLFNASGIEKASLSGDATGSSLFLYDNSIQILCRFLVCLREQEPAKVLGMIRPTLEKWLSISTTENIIASRQIIHARAALSIVAAITWDEIHPQISLNKDTTSTTQSDALKLDPQFDELLLSAMIGIFELLSTMNLPGNDISGVIARLLGPITLILFHREGMLMKYLQEYLNRFSKAESDNDSISLIDAEVQIKTVTLVLQTKIPGAVSSIIQNQDDLKGILLSLAKMIEKSVSKSHLLPLGERLSHDVNHIIK